MGHALIQTDLDRDLDGACIDTDRSRQGSRWGMHLQTDLDRDLDGACIYRQI